MAVYGPWYIPPNKTNAGNLKYGRYAYFKIYKLRNKHELILEST